MNRDGPLTFFLLLTFHRKKLFLTLICLFLSNLLALAIPWGIKIIVDEVLVKKDIRLLNGLVAALLAILTVRALLSFLKKYLSDIIGENILCDIRQKLFGHVQRLALGHIYKMTPAQIVSRITGDVNSIRHFLFGDALDFVYAVFNLAILLVVLGMLNVQLTLWALVTLPLFGLVYFRFIPELKKKFAQLGDSYGLLTARISEVLNGIRTVRAFAAAGYEQRQLAERQQRILATASQTHWLSAVLWVGIDFFTSLGTIAILWIGGRLVISGRLTAGELIAFYTYLGMLFSPMIRMVIINSSYQEARAALNRINEILAVDVTPQKSRSPLRFAKIRGAVEFRNISFGYSPGEDVLKNISFSVDPGETIGIVGVSGVGKTTLMSLLLRFYDPRQGEITVDGYPVRDWDLDSYRRQLAVVLQDDFLFQGSVKDNIRYGTFDAADQRVIAAAQAAQAHEFVLGFKERYDTEIGERGLNLSCGQRQRLAIARALVKDPTILILDEATSAVDALTENRIQKSLREHLPAATIFVVAHRFSTIMEADRIIVLEKGRIVEMGTHVDLVKAEGFYCQLYREQFKKTEEDPLAGVCGTHGPAGK